MAGRRLREFPAPDPAGVRVNGTRKLVLAGYDFSDAEIPQAGTPYPQVEDGHFSLPAGLGWGVELDFDFLKKHAARIEAEVILDPGLDLFRKSDWFKRSKSSS